MPDNKALTNLMVGLDELYNFLILWFSIQKFQQNEIPTQIYQKHFVEKHQKKGSGRKLGNLGNFFPKFLSPSFEFWLQGKIENSDIRKLGIIFPRFPTFPIFPSFRFAIFSFFKNFSKVFSILKYRNSRRRCSTGQVFLKIS